MLRVLILMVALFAASPLAARAAEFGEAVRALNADSFAAKIDAVEALAAMGDSRVPPLLEAMADGRLYGAADGAVAIETANGYADAVTGGAITGGDVQAITVNNRLRGVLRGVMGRLGLFSTDAGMRRRAAEAVLATPSAEAGDMLRDALAKEGDAGVRDVMTVALAVVDLESPVAERRLAAVDRLAGSLDSQVRNLLQQMLNKESDPAIKRAAETALAGLEAKLKALDLAANLFQGISLGSVLLLAAIGLAVTFGVMGVINMAHGEMIMLGAYTTFVVQEAFRAWLPPALFGFYLPVAVPAAFLVSALVGIALERGVIRFLYGRPLETLLATWGISLILQQIVRTIFGAPNKEVANPDWMTGGIEVLGGFTLTYNRLVIIVFCLVVLAGLAALLRYSAFGLHMRAVTQNRPMGAAMGIRTGRVDALTFGLGSGIAGIAGVALSQIGNVSPNLGQGYIVDSFMVVVFGGVGSLWGTLVAALSLGLVNKFLEPYAGAMLGKIIVLVFIILFIQKRPRGLFALKGRSVES